MFVNLAVPNVDSATVVPATLSRNWFIAGVAALCFVTGIALSRLIEPGVRVQKVTLAEETPALKFIPAAPLNLTLSQPLIPKENILLIQGRYDLLVETEQTGELWQKWNQPEIWRLPHRHVSWMFAPGLTDRMLAWLAPRLEKSTLSAPV